MVALNRPVHLAQLQLLIFLPRPVTTGTAGLQKSSRHPSQEEAQTLNTHLFPFIYNVRSIHQHQPGSRRSRTKIPFATPGRGEAARRDAWIISPFSPPGWLQTWLTPSAPPSPGSIPAKPSCGLGCRRSSRSRWHGCCGAGPGRALLTHPIGIRRLHWLFIGPHRPQKALGLAFLPPSPPPSRWLALAQHRRGSKRNAVGKPAGPSATFPSTAKFLALR